MEKRDKRNPHKRWVTGGTRIPAHEKRYHERHELREMFRCFIGGQKVLSLALDQGGGGAFLTMSVLPRPGTVIVLEVENDLKQRQVFLVAEVARRQLLPVKGVGVRWLRAVGLGSVDSLLAFVEHHLRLPVDKLRNGVRPGAMAGKRPMIDFEAGVLQLMSRVAQGDDLAELMRRGIAEPPVPGVPPPIPEDTVEDLFVEDVPPEITAGQGMVRLDAKVHYRFGGQAHKGVLRFASSSHFVVDSTLPLPGRDGRLYVEWSDRDRDGVGEVVLRGEVEHEVLSPSGTWRIEARITALSEGGRPGLYKEFLLRYGD